MNPTDNLFVRVELIRTDDKGEQQTVELWGRPGERLGGPKYGVTRQQAYGFSAHAPPGAVGMVVMLDGNPDQAIALDVEHPEYRPKDLPEGDVQVYDMRKQVVWLMEGKILIESPGDVIIKSGGIVHINPDD